MTTHARYARVFTALWIAYYWVVSGTVLALLPVTFGARALEFTRS